MRRTNAPFNGKQFVLNKNTGEIHDLDNEKRGCQIDEIKPEHVYNCDSYMKAVLAASMLCEPALKANGCFYCLPDENNG
ncbi:3-hydroxyacyl-CoA dehydrogenase [Lachnospiraceae bacterium LCP25S3_G4]